jgi:hypothetical protein
MRPSGRATEKRSQPNGYCAFFFPHIFAVAKSLRLFSSQPQKRHLQPKRYVPLVGNILYKK